jgi:hypothetical protein
MKSLKPIKVLAGFIGIYHILLGLIGSVSGELGAQAARAIFDARVDLTPQFSYLVKYLGAYTIAFGVMMLLVAWNPVKYKLFIYVGILLIAIRITQRLIFASQLESAFGISQGRNLLNTAIIALLALGLYLFRPRET